MEGLVGLLPIAAILLLFWFLLIRPQAKRTREQQQMQSALEVGDEVMLAAGVFGEIVGILDDRVEVEIAPDVVVTVLRAAISRVVPDDHGEADAYDETDQHDETDQYDGPGDDEEPSLLRKRPANGSEEG